MRIILFTGKGGVGKTTLAAATGVLCSEKGYKTLTMSTDSAHSLSDAFDVPVGPEPTTITPNLHGLEVDVNREINENWEDIQKHFATVLNFNGIDAVVADEMVIFPGMEELFSLVKLQDYYDEQRYDVVIVDCAPTGETLKLLSLPEVIRWYMRHIFPIQKNIARMARPLARIVTNLPIPDDEFFKSSQQIYEKVGKIKDTLTNESVTSIRIVLNPEKMVIQEAQRSLTYFSLFDLPVDLIIANRIIPPTVRDPYFDKWKENQNNYLNMIEERFSPLPIFSNLLYSEEISGLSLLRKMAEMVYGERDPLETFYTGKPVTLSKDKDSYTLSIKIPFLDKEDLSLLKNNDQLIIKAGKYKRNVLLPRTLHSLELTGAKFEAEKGSTHESKRTGYLKIRFTEDKNV
jgi:arsenite-transporting ATPase